VFRVRAHNMSTEETFKAAARVGLAGIAKDSTCPPMIIGSSLYTPVQRPEQKRLVAEVPSLAETRALADANHCANDVCYIYCLCSTDWVAEHLGVL